VHELAVVTFKHAHVWNCGQSTINALDSTVLKLDDAISLRLCWVL
jgi:hypothetical protein